MADYWGQQAIAARLSVSETTVEHWRRTRGLLMYARRKPGSPRLWWYSNDALIVAWEHKQCLADANRKLSLRHGRKTPQPAAAVPAAPPSDPS